ncbi:DUF3955 domain-containing protein [Burkholderia pseudomallei]|uniref:DUF3955 domain-containing protein n=1 Tax=Burkholderia pseudomallei TaxID=28450 RepID=UPI000A1CD2B3|nr:DUF3955 domain-containing protein [Burkholderia pseudomallei]OSP94317.1 hypothetical protein BOC41_17590 [Burkholderia pseudomallei]TXD05398.1 DUF3955 domain-containing protein [Burkholderia pseudomallei]
MVYPALHIVSAVALVVTIVAAVSDANRCRYWIVCACFILAGCTCWLAFAAIGSKVDSQGVLHEPFVLIPMGRLMVGVGVIGSLLRGAVALYRRQSRGIN